MIIRNNATVYLSRGTSHPQFSQRKTGDNLLTFCISQLLNNNPKLSVLECEFSSTPLAEGDLLEVWVKKFAREMWSYLGGNLFVSVQAKRAVV